MTRYNDLYEHQRTGVDMFVKNKHGFMNTGEPGTGKSATVIVAAEKLDVKRFLMIGPSALKLTWDQEFRTWGTLNWHLAPVVGAKAKRMKILERALKQERFAIFLNYEAIISKDVYEMLIKQSFDLIVADEQHRIKDHRTKSTQALKTLRAKYRWGLTGTPTPNGPLDIWSQVDFIRPGYLHKNFYAFRQRYAEIYTGAGFPVITKYINQDELKRLVDAVTYRVTKEECLQLPDKIFKEVVVELDSGPRKLYDQMAKQMFADLGGGVSVSARVALTKMLRLQQITSGFIKTDDGLEKPVGTEKLDALLDILKDFENDSVIVWTRFAWEVEAIIKAVGKKRTVYEFTGRISSTDKQSNIIQFQTGGPAIMVANLQAGGVGITLTRACTSIYYSRDYSFANYEQSNNRVHRPGQDRVCVYYDLVCKDTIDRHIIDVVKKKQTLSDRLTGDDIRRMINGISSNYQSVS